MKKILPIILLIIGILFVACSTSKKQTGSRSIASLFNTGIYPNIVDSSTFVVQDGYEIYHLQTTQKTEYQIQFRVVKKMKPDETVFVEVVEVKLIKKRGPYQHTFLVLNVEAKINFVEEIAGELNISQKEITILKDGKEVGKFFDKNKAGALCNKNNKIELRDKSTGNIIDYSKVCDLFLRTKGNTHLANISLREKPVTTSPNTWVFEIENKIQSPPVIADGVVYFTSEGNIVYAINAKTGKKMWAYPIESKNTSFPVIEDGTVYVGSMDKGLYAIDAKSGERKRAYKPVYPVVLPPAISSGVIYLGSIDDASYLYAINAKSGKKIWKYKTGGWLGIYTPTIVGEVVYVATGSSSGDNLYAIHTVTGKKIWSCRVAKELGYFLTIVDKVIYVGSGDNNLYAIDAKSGKKIWTYNLGYRARFSPAVADGVIYVGSSDKKLYAINAKSGKKIWTYQAGGSFNYHPAIADGVVYVGSSDKKLYAIDATSGKKIWAYNVGDHVQFSPAVAGGVVYVGSKDNKLYAIDAKTGEIFTPSKAK